MSNLKFHHIGIACENIEKEIESYKLLGYELETPIFTDQIQKVKGTFMINNAFRIELLEPLSNDSPLHNYLLRGIKMYHQCFSCENMNAAIDSLKAQGAKLICPPVSAIAFKNKNIAFLMLKSKTLIELVEEEGVY
jgi:methylmalonyl-CoA/ethylmalonyl-CoA epimerase